jgi:hypothetical protein
MRIFFAAVGRHDQIVGAIEQRFSGLVDSLTLRGDGVGDASEVPSDLVQDIRRIRILSRAGSPSPRYRPGDQ